MAVKTINGGQIPPKQGLYCIGHYNAKRGWRIVSSTGAGVPCDKLPQLASEWIQDRDSWFAKGDRLVILNAWDLTESDLVFDEFIGHHLRRGLYWVKPDTDVAKLLHPELLKEQFKVVRFSHNENYESFYAVSPLAGGGVVVVPSSCLTAIDPYAVKQIQTPHTRLKVLETQEQKDAKLEARRQRLERKAVVDKVKADKARQGVLGNIQSVLDEKVK